jgi:DNA modification methylase
MRPYYHHAGITIYHGDCRDVGPLGDVFITDPPYGVELGTSDSRGREHGLAHLAYASFADTFDEWRELVPPMITQCVMHHHRGAVFTGKHLTHFPPPAFCGGVYLPAGCGRNPWGYTNWAAIFFYGVDPQLHRGARQTVLVSSETSERNGHPCPKPIGWMRWLVQRVSLPGETIFDPFAGSGTTLVAAKQVGRQAIGIEREEKYCELAAVRLQQESFSFEVGA